MARRKRTSRKSAAMQGRRGPEAPHSRPAEPLQEGAKYDQLADKASKTKDRQDALLDEALEETFPSSDPISPKHIT